MFVYHGTTIENAESIIKNGWNKKSTQNWICSSPNAVYFSFSEENQEEAVEMAIQAGQIAAAIQNSKSENIAVFALEIPEEEKEDILMYYRDYSCPNMSEIALEIPVEMVEKYSMKMIEVKEVYLPSMRLAYLSNNREYMAKPQLTAAEQMFVEDKNHFNFVMDMSMFACEQVWSQVSNVLQAI